MKRPQRKSAITGEPTPTEFLHPLTTMAFRWRLSREALLRAVYTGRIRGEQRGARWYVDERDAPRAALIRAAIEARRAVNAATALPG